MESNKLALVIRKAPCMVPWTYSYKIHALAFPKALGIISSVFSDLLIQL